METLLQERDELMKSSDGGESDQYRVYQYIIGELEKGTRFLRVMVQASAGTGKSFLMTTVMLWCIVNGKNARAAAPTGMPRPENAQNGPSGGFLGPFGGQGPKMLKMSLLGASWCHLVANARKFSK